jgi:hypothetical protein
MSTQSAVAVAAQGGNTGNQSMHFASVIGSELFNVEAVVLSLFEKKKLE